MRPLVQKQSERESRLLLRLWKHFGEHVFMQTGERSRFSPFVLARLPDFRRLAREL